MSPIPVRRSISVVVLLACAWGCDPAGPEPTPLLTPPDDEPVGVAFAPYSLEVEDFDGDLDMDLLIGGIDAGSVVFALRRGDGDGGFGPATLTAIDDACSAYPAVGSITGARAVDVLVSACAGQLSVWQGRSTGFFPWSAWPSTFVYGPGSTSSVGDFEGDGDGDVVTLQFASGGNEVRIFTTLGNGRDDVWRVEGTSVGIPALSDFQPTGLALAHLDDDRFLDVVLTDPDHDLASMLGLPTGGFALPLELGVDVVPSATRVADLDGDGLDDVVAVSLAGQQIQPLLSLGTGEVDPRPPMPLGLSPADVVLADLDADGVIDLAAIDVAAPTLRWFSGDGDGTFTAAQTFALPSAAVRLHAADVDGDGDQDLVVATFAAGSIEILLGP